MGIPFKIFSIEPVKIGGETVVDFNGHKKTVRESVSHIDITGVIDENNLHDPMLRPNNKLVLEWFNKVGIWERALKEFHKYDELLDMIPESMLLHQLIQSVFQKEMKEILKD